MIASFLLLAATGAGASSPGAAPATLVSIAEGPKAQIAAAARALARCHFSHIEVADALSDRAELRVPARELGPKQANCLNNVADELRLRGVTWSGPDVRQH